MAMPKFGSALEITYKSRNVKPIEFPTKAVLLYSGYNTGITTAVNNLIKKWKSVLVISVFDHHRFDMPSGGPLGDYMVCNFDNLYKLKRTFQLIIMDGLGLHAAKMTMNLRWIENMTKMDNLIRESKNILILETIPTEQITIMLQGTGTPYTTIRNTYTTTQAIKHTPVSNLNATYKLLERLLKTNKIHVVASNKYITKLKSKFKKKINLKVCKKPKKQKWNCKLLLSNEWVALQNDFDEHFDMVVIYGMMPLLPRIVTQCALKAGVTHKVQVLTLS